MLTCLVLPCSPRQQAAFCSRRCHRRSPAVEGAAAAQHQQTARAAVGGAGVAAVAAAGHASGRHQLKSSETSCAVGMACKQ